METKIQRWGNSLAVRIPKPFAQDIHLRAGMKAHVNLLDYGIVVQPILKAKNSLVKLLEKVTLNQLHGEVESGKPVGREIW